MCWWELLLSYKYFGMFRSCICKLRFFSTVWMVELCFLVKVYSVIFSYMMKSMMTTRRWPSLTTEYKPRDWKEEFVLNTQHIPTHTVVESVFNYFVCSVHLRLTCALEVRGFTGSHLLNFDKFDKLYIYFCKSCKKSASIKHRTAAL